MRKVRAGRCGLQDWQLVLGGSRERWGRGYLQHCWGTFLLLVLGTGWSDPRHRGPLSIAQDREEIKAQGTARSAVEGRWGKMAGACVMCRSHMYVVLDWGPADPGPGHSPCPGWPRSLPSEEMCPLQPAGGVSGKQEKQKSSFSH